MLHYYVHFEVSNEVLPTSDSKVRSKHYCGKRVLSQRDQ